MSLGWYYGVEGITDAIQLPPNIVQVNLQRSVNEVSGEYRDFALKFEKLVVVSFGTTFFHSQEGIEALSQVLISHSEIGFVVSMKPSYPGFELL